jgi:hypothetical protein
VQKIRKTLNAQHSTLTPKRSKDVEHVSEVSSSYGCTNEVFKFLDAKGGFALERIFVRYRRAGEALSGAIMAVGLAG